MISLIYHVVSEVHKSLDKNTNYILLVDDDKDILNLYSEFLRLNGFPVVAFDDPIKALNFARDNISTLSIVITDYKMPEISGIELIKKIYDTSNGDNTIKFILISAYLKENLIHLDDTFVNISNNDDRSTELSLKIHKQLEKPLTLESLRASIYELYKQC